MGRIGSRSRESTMKTKLWALLVFAITGIAHCQFTPPANLGYLFNTGTGAWQPLSASSGTPVAFVPPAVSLYGVLSSGAATPCTTAGNCFSAGGGGITALTQDVTASGTGSVAATVVGINGTLLSGLATGPLCNTTTTGVPSACTLAS